MRSVHTDWLLLHLQGDRVVVISGDLKNLIGRVERVAEGGKVDIMPKMEGLTDILTFEVTQLEKYFEVRRQPSRVSNSSACFVNVPILNKEWWLELLFSHLAIILKVMCQ